MARRLTPHEFYHNLAKRTDIDEKDCKRNFEIFIEFVIEELRMYGEIQIPNFGEMKAIQKGGKYQHIPIDSFVKNTEEKNKTKIIYVEPYLQSVFKPTKNFKETLNGGKVSRAEMIRQREEFKNKKKLEEEAQRQIDIVEKQTKAIELERNKRLERIRKRKEYQDLHTGKKARKFSVSTKTVDSSDYGSLKER